MAEMSSDPVVERSVQENPLATALGKPTVLVVDDQESVCFVLQALLEHKGFTVLTARDLQGAIEILRDPGQRITLAIVDGDLGDGYGLQSSASQLTAALRAKGIEFVRYSGSVEDIPTQERGMERYSKPYDQARMIEVLADSYLSKTE